MKEKADLVLGWLRKAQSDRVALDVTLRARLTLSSESSPFIAGGADR
jgi:hypothetical protein